MSYFPSLLPFANNIFPIATLIFHSWSRGVENPGRKADERVKEEWKTRKISATPVPVRLNFKGTPLPFGMEGIDLFAPFLSRGSALLGNGMIHAPMFFAVEDPEGFFFCLRHEAAHLKHEDPLKNAFKLLLANTAIAGIMVHYLPSHWLSSLATLGVTFIAQRALSSYLSENAEIAADAAAIEESTDMEILGGIRFLVLSRLLERTANAQDKKRSQLLNMLQPHPESEHRLRAVRSECKNRKLQIPEKCDVEEMARLLVALQFPSQCEIKDHKINFKNVSMLDSIRYFLEKNPLLLSTYPLPEDVRILSHNDLGAQFYKEPPLTVCHFDQNAVGKALLKAYQEELGAPGMEEKKKYNADAKQVVFDMGTKIATILDSQKKTLRSFSIPSEDLECLSQHDNREVVKKIARQWTQVPMSLTVSHKPNAHLRALYAHQSSDYVQRLMKKHSIVFIGNDEERRQIWLKFAEKITLQDGSVHVFKPGPLQEADRTILDNCVFEYEHMGIMYMLANIDEALKAGKTEHASTKWGEAIASNPLVILAAKEFFPSLVQRFMD